MKPLDCIMLVDDDDLAIFYNEFILKKANTAKELISFTNGKEALEKLRSGEGEKCFLPDLILLDLYMPVIDGFRFLEEFNKLPEHIRNKVKVVILSSSSYGLDYEKATAYDQVIGFLQKPLAIESLTGLLDGSLN